MPSGGKRDGAGRPADYGIARKNCTMKATLEEWQIIKDFAQILKHGDRKAAIEFVKQLRIKN